MLLTERLVPTPCPGEVESDAEGSGAEAAEGGATPEKPNDPATGQRALCGGGALRKQGSESRPVTAHPLGRGRPVCSPRTLHSNEGLYQHGNGVLMAATLPANRTLGGGGPHSPLTHCQHPEA